MQLDIKDSMQIRLKENMIILLDMALNPIEHSQSRAASMPLVTILKHKQI